MSHVLNFSNKKTEYENLMQLYIDIQKPGNEYRYYQNLSGLFIGLLVGVMAFCASCQ